MNEFCEAFESIVDQLVELNECNRLRFTDYKKSMHYNQWLCEFCTIKLNLGRAVGKSLYIKQNCQHNDVVIVPTVEMKKNYKNEIDRHVFTIQEVMRMYPDVAYRYQPTTIFVDECKLKSEIMYHVYTVFGRPSLYQTFIVLGA